MIDNLQKTDDTKSVPVWVKFWDSITRPSDKLEDVGQRRKAKLTAGLIIVLTISSVVGIFASPGSSPFYLLAVSLVGVISYFLSRTRYYPYGSFLFILSLSTLPYITIFSSPTPKIENRIYAWIPLALIIASSILNRWALFLFTGISAGAIVSLIFFFPSESNTVAQTSGIITTFGLLLVYLESFREGIEKARLGELQKANQELSNISQFLEERVSERTAQLNRRTSHLEAAALVARTAAETPNIKILLDNVVEQISSRFGFYHTGIFLSDSERQKVYLAAASSEGGKKMLERGHRLDIGRQGVVGYAAYEKRPRVAQDIEYENVYFRNPDLPETRSEAALPLLAKNQVIGVLDIQSTEQNAFSSEDLFLLQTMADQIALAIQNARLLEETNLALEQLQNITSKNIQDAWKSYLSDQTKGYVYLAGDVLPIDIQKQQETQPNQHSLKLNIELRGQTIGSITLKRTSDDSDWTEKEQEFTEKIAAQIALAIENARLLEDSQRRAAREQTLNELTTRLSRSLDLENLLQNAVLELHKLPQVTDASVVIAPQEIQKPA